MERTDPGTWPTLADRRPRRGQRIIVTGAHIAGGIPAHPADAPVGTYATWHGVIGGLHALEGNTADRTFVDPDRVRWIRRPK